MIPSDRFALASSRFGPRSDSTSASCAGVGHQALKQQRGLRQELHGAACNLLLSKRMRCILEYALGLNPSYPRNMEQTKAMDLSALSDILAHAVVALVEYHHVPLPLVVQALKAPARHGDLGISDAGNGIAYMHLLAEVRAMLRTKGVSSNGINLDAPENWRKSHVKPVDFGPELWQAISAACNGRIATAGAPGADCAEVLAAQRRRLATDRPWFGGDICIDAELSNHGFRKSRRKVVVDKLPVWSKRDDIVQTVRDFPISLLQAETGSGKTTQVPQYLLEDLAGHNERLRIVVTQPRRIAAISVAQRVCEERGEIIGKGEVGYKIRGTTVAGPGCRLLFCTTGVLLRRLAAEGEGDHFSMQTVTHLIIDEVHERSSETDFLLTFLKKALPSQPHLRVLLMSATMDAESLCRYFTTRELGVPPLLQASGTVYPVTEVYMDAIQLELGTVTITRASRPQGDADEPEGVPYDIICQLIAEICDVPDGLRRFLPDAKPMSGDTLSPQPRSEEFSKGAVLVFLQGAGEINELCTRLKAHPGGQKWWILPLHASLPIEQQQECFRTTWPDGMTSKIVVATNVAETSVTIPDVTVVVDSCQERRMGVERTTNTPSLREQWCAKDALQQRRGRAGRVRAGVCFRLVPQRKFEAFAKITPPEIQRAPLENIYLQVCASRIRDPAAFLACMPDPPDSLQVRFAETALRDMGALDDTTSDGLSPLGRHLAALPCHPRLGKILVLGCMLTCPGPCLSIVSILSMRSPMLHTADVHKRAAWQRAREELLKAAGCRSDHCAWAAFFIRWHQTNPMHQRHMCDHYGLSFERMQMASMERQHLCEGLVMARLLPSDFMWNELQQSTYRKPNWLLVRSAVVGGLYPSVLHAERMVPHGVSKLSEAREKAEYMRFTLQQRHLAQKGEMHYPINVHLHPSSLLWGHDDYEFPWLACFMIQHTSKLYAYDVSEAVPYALLLFGESPAFAKDAAGNCQVSVGDLVHLKCDAGAEILRVLVAARRAWQIILQQKLEKPWVDYGQSRELSAIIKLLSTGGLGFELRTATR